MNQNKEHRLKPESMLAGIEGGNSGLKYKTNQIVYSQGEPADFVFYVRTGRVKMTVASEAGKEAVVAILQPGQLCGEDSLTGHKLRTATVTALSECVLARMSKASVIRALHDNAEFSELFTTHL